MARSGYSRAQIRLHWAVVVLVVLQYALHDGVAQAFDDGLRSGTMVLTGGAIGHMAGGGLILLLAMLRLLLRRDQGVPPPPAVEPDWAKTAATATHHAFYGLLILLPISGGLAWGLASATVGTVHEVLRAVLLLLILAHVGAVLVHQFVWKTNLMDRMRTPVD